ncbi:MAG TPA: hypothetical protein VMV20_01590 [Chitinophagaceae bacterium]|nr:hypothetical protein [Chitinophagaceae bacterium]
MMKCYPVILTGLFWVLLESCSTTYSFYGSPVFGKTASYTTKPLLSDSVHSATYSSLVFSDGFSNFFSQDPIYAGQLRLYQVRQFSLFHFFYGTDLMLGNYGIANYQDTGVTTIVGNHFFGNLGISGGGDFSLPIGKSEWRMIGVDLSLNQEFGSYLGFRMKQPVTIDTGVFKHSFLGTLALSSEWAFHTRHGEFGFKYEFGTYLGNQGFLANNFIFPPSGLFHSSYRFYQFSFHVTFKQWTGYILEQGGTWEGDSRLGVIYRFQPRYKNK